MKARGGISLNNKKGEAMNKKSTTKKAAEPAAAKSASAESSSGKRRVKFELSAERNIDVFVAGTFNNWDPTQKRLVDKSNDGVYQCFVMLAPGTYEYKFYVNNTWCVDPANPNFNQNDLGTLNSVLVVS